MSLCVIVPQFEDKSNGVTYKEQTRKKLLQCVLLTKKIKRRFRPCPFEVPRYKESISLCDTPKTKGHKKRMLLRKKHPQFQR